MKTETEKYYTLDEIEGKFRIVQSYPVPYGNFMLTRYLYSINAIGGRTWARIAFFLLFTFALTPATLAIDFVILSIYLVLMLIKKTIEAIIMALVKVCQRFLGTVAVIAAIAGCAIILYYNWHAIVAFLMHYINIIVTGT